MEEFAQLMSGLGEEWRGAFERAPRSAFVPEKVWAPDGGAPTGYRRISRGDDPDGWWALVDADAVVVTQVDDGIGGGPGTATSSASMPSLVADMLRHLEVSDGHAVLDVGTGTGWTSALLCARLGDEQVTTVEVDPVLAAEAALRLGAAGFAPNRVVGDGLAGWPHAAPYDRIHSTAAVRRVPWAWIEQTRPGGVIVTPWGTSYANAGLLRLVVGERGQASHGRFVGNVSFMWMRAQRPHAVTGPLSDAPDHYRQGPSAMDPELALEDVHAAFAIGLRVPGVRYEHVWDEADPSGTFRMQLSDGAGSWASVRYARWNGEDAVQQCGPRRLWDEIVGARRWWWGEEGRPDLGRFGVTVGVDGAQSVWLDDPGNTVAVR
ncbi:methyltransferase domain-containing protein [Kitasatospora sp. NPDC058397]|uniref:methyltransferase domain-containing protein n=1 Tax=unclassified Kitasatospora TaxID=2633591 RepID=UPI003648DA6C